MGERDGLAVRAAVLLRWSAGVVGVVMLASCSAGTGAPSVPVGTTTPTPALAVSEPADSEVDPVRRAALAAYVGMWQAMARAAQKSDWQSPELAHYATGDALTAVVRSLYADYANGVVTRGAPTNSPVVRSAEPPDAPTRVLIDDCGDSTHSLKYLAGTDTPAGAGSGGGRRAITAEVVLQPDGVWRVTRFAVQGLGSC